MAAGKGRLIAAVALAASLMPLNSTMVAVALPEMGRSLALSPAALTRAVIASYLLTGIVLQSPGGKLGDRLGYRRVLGLGQLTLGLGAALGYFASSLAPLVAARILMGAGGALLVPNAAALLRAELPFQQRGRAFGAFGGVMSLAAAVGPVLGGELVRRFGWPSIFLVNLPVLLLSAGLAFLRTAPEPARAPEGPASGFDWVGSLLLALALGLAMSALRGGSEHHGLLLLAGALSFVPFVWWELRVRDPVVEFALFRRPVFSAGSLLMMLQNVALYAMIFELPHLMDKLFALDSRGVGRLISVMTATMVVFSPIAGRLSDRVGARSIAVTGTLATLVAVGLLRFRPLVAPSSLILPLVVLGLGIALSSAPAQSASLSAVPREKSGTAAGMSSTLRFVGAVLGAAALTFAMSDTRDVVLALREHAVAVNIYIAALGLTVVCALVLPARVRTPAVEAPLPPAPERPGA